MLSWRYNTTPWDKQSRQPPQNNSCRDNTFPFYSPTAKPCISSVTGYVAINNDGSGSISKNSKSMWPNFRLGVFYGQVIQNNIICMNIDDSRPDIVFVFSANPLAAAHTELWYLSLLSPFMVI